MATAPTAMTALINQPMMASRPACARSSRGAKPRPLEWHLGDRARVRADRIDPMRKRVEFALVEQS